MILMIMLIKIYGDYSDYVDYEDVEENSLSEGRKKTGTKLCARGISAAQSKFKVYPNDNLIKLQFNRMTV